ncbi:MAG: MoxR family ATPase [Acidobacteria bacterium]|nr:MoxR family ATPase [Acidobacteriota bacterium]
MKNREVNVELSVEQKKELEIVERFHTELKKIDHEVRKVIVGQKDVVDQVMISMLTGGHSIITGVPGLAKTLLIATVAQVLHLDFKRIQFTPDLMPADITGTEIIEEDRTSGRRVRVFVKGPIFANIILADEINRTPPKTQSALLEAMQEGSVSIEGNTYILEQPFYVLATQNPIELEGTYPLPEAQLDRFMFNIIIDYLNEEDEIQVVSQTTTLRTVEFEKTISGSEILEFQRLVRKMPVADSIMRYAVQLARTSRPSGENPPDFVKQYLNYGASLRASQFLILGAKARALIHGRYNVSVEDIQSLMYPVFRHRLLTNFHAESEGIRSEDIIKRLLEHVPVPTSGLKD